MLFRKYQTRVTKIVHFASPKHWFRYMLLLNVNHEGLAAVSCGLLTVFRLIGRESCGTSWRKLWCRLLFLKGNVEKAASGVLPWQVKSYE